MRRGVLIAAAAGLLATMLAPTSAMAQRRGDWYRDVRPYLNGRGASTAGEARLWEEVVDLRSAVRRLDRRGDLTPRQADRFYDRLDRVARFLQNDRTLSDSEFKRRQDDLQDIARDLHRDARVRPTSYEDGRSSRRDDRSTRSYDRSTRSDYCPICNGACRYR
jgi:hypothetical protein